MSKYWVIGEEYVVCAMLWKGKREEEYWGQIGGEHGVSWPSSLTLILLYNPNLIAFIYESYNVLFYAMLNLGIMHKYGEVMSNFS